jgi:DNA sulfur modification protein DndD
MYIASITLRDWKAFSGATTLNFPAPTERKNVVLIGAQNGFGKTTLLEALLFGLYGKDACAHVARASRAEGGYATFLAKALHSGALPAGRSSMSVEIALAGEGGEAEDIVISRTWYFRPDGEFREEEVRVFEGDNRTPVRKGALDGDEEDFYRSYIATRVLPSHLAQFFLFDGEQVQSLAQDKKSDQVKAGIEGILGASVLRALADSLTEYAKKQRQQNMQGASDAELQGTQAALGDLEAQLQQNQNNLEREKTERARLADERDGLVQDLQNLNSGGIDNIAELEQKRQRAQSELEKHRNDLQQLLMGELGIALMGQDLLTQLKSRLIGEGKLVQWQYSKSASADQFENFASKINAAWGTITPAMTGGQIQSVLENLRTAWDEMWNPPPQGAARDVRHSYLTDEDRLLCVRRIDLALSVGMASVEDALAGMQAAERDLGHYRTQITNLGSIKPKLEEVTGKLARASQQYGAVDQRVGELERLCASLKSSAEQKRAEHQRLLSRHQSARPIIRRIELATAITKMIPELVSEATHHWVKRIARAMTAAFEEIAHKKAIARVDISNDCQVRLLTKSGEDYRKFDASAGEDQVFSFALISAIAKATQLKFPIVVDTPLARLDHAHRVNILRHFTDRGREQIILLSQDTEVVGEYLDAIRARVGAKFMIKTTTHRNGSVASIAPDTYFEEI